MSEIIKMNYPAMREAAQHFKQVAQRLLETVRLTQNIASQMENGALVGGAGTQFVNALRSGLMPAVQRLSQKCEEVSKDLMAAMEAMQAEDAEAGGRF